MMLIMNVERPLVEEPLVPEKWDDPPEIPDEGFTVDKSFRKVTVHMMIAQSPVTEVEVVETYVQNRC